MCFHLISGSESDAFIHQKCKLTFKIQKKTRNWTKIFCIVKNPKLINVFALSLNKTRADLHQSPEERFNI